MEIRTFRMIIENVINMWLAYQAIVIFQSHYSSLQEKIKQRISEEVVLNMTWTVLSDNRTQNPSLQTEHGLSILLETEKHRILLDTGASDVFIRNAEVMGINLSTVDNVFISHADSSACI